MFSSYGGKQCIYVTYIGQSPNKYCNYWSNRQW